MIFLQKFKTASWNILMVLFLALSFTACRDEQFDQPPSNGTDPNLTANKTILEIKDFFRDTVLTDKKTVSIDSSWVISGTVVADDSSGNYYKTMVIDDGTAGILILLDRSDYFRDYPIGRKVYIKLQGMAIGSYAGTMQIGGYVDNTVTPTEVGKIPGSLISKYIVGGVYNLPVVPYSVTLIDLAANTYLWQSRLVKLSNMQFQPADTSKPFADPIGLSSENRYLDACYDETIIMRTSGYCNFAAQLTPSGSGSCIAVFGVFNLDNQLTLRRPYDIEMNSPRFAIPSCPTPPPPPPPAATLVTISSIRTSFTGSGSVGSNKKIAGIVISDSPNGNTDSKNLFVQDATGGICVRFTAAHSFVVGDSVEINVGGQTISEFNGLLQIGGTTPSVPVGYSAKLGIGTVTPRLITIADILSNMSGSTDTYESTLVKIVGVTITGATTTYSGSTTLSDGTGTLTMFTRSAATFSTATFPTGVVNITGVISDFNAAQIFIRKTADVQ
jgi:hypothetical protein